MPSRCLVNGMFRSIADINLRDNKSRARDTSFYEELATMAQQKTLYITEIFRKNKQILIKNSHRTVVFAYAKEESPKLNCI